MGRRIGQPIQSPSSSSRLSSDTPATRFARRALVLVSLSVWQLLSSVSRSPGWMSRRHRRRRCSRFRFVDVVFIFVCVPLFLCSVPPHVLVLQCPFSNAVHHSNPHSAIRNTQHPTQSSVRLRSPRPRPPQVLTPQASSRPLARQRHSADTGQPASPGGPRAAAAIPD